MTKKEIVIQYGSAIGIPYEWYRNERHYYDWKNEWHDLLHELGHLAVYPQSVLEEYQEARQRCYVKGFLTHTLITPDLIDGEQELLASMRYFPNEYAVRCWCLDSLRLLRLPNPIEEEGYYEHPAGKRERNVAQWLEPPEVFRGREQLYNWGIDVLRGKTRPDEYPREILLGAWCPRDRQKYVDELVASTSNGKAYTT